MRLMSLFLSMHVKAIVKLSSRVWKTQTNQRQRSLSIITVFAVQCSRESGKRKSNALVRWTPVGARAGSCCHSNHWGEIRAASDAVALPQWGGCSSCGQTDGTSRLTVTHHKATRKGKCGGNSDSCIALEGRSWKWRLSSRNQDLRVSVIGDNCGL